MPFQAHIPPCFASVENLLCNYFKGSFTLQTSKMIQLMFFHHKNEHKRERERERERGREKD